MHVAGKEAVRCALITKGQCNRSREGLPLCHAVNVEVTEQSQGCTWYNVRRLLLPPTSLRAVRTTTGDAFVSRNMRTMALLSGQETGGWKLCTPIGAGVFVVV